jgi:hypothetical protein
MFSCTSDFVAPEGLSEYLPASFAIDVNLKIYVIRTPLYKYSQYNHIFKELITYHHLVL